MLLVLILGRPTDGPILEPSRPDALSFLVRVGRLHLRAITGVKPPTGDSESQVPVAGETCHQRTVFGTPRAVFQKLLANSFLRRVENPTNLALIRLALLRASVDEAEVDSQLLPALGMVDNRHNTIRRKSRIKNID